MIVEIDRSRKANTSSVERLQPHTAQRKVLSQAARFNIVDCGRRWGKTILGQDLNIGVLLQGYPVGWFSPTYKDSREVYSSMQRTLAPITTSRNKMEGRIVVENGGLVEFWSMDDPDAGRSRHYKRVVIDEAAKALNLEYSWNFAIRATLADLQGDAWFLSTPRGREYFYRLFALGQDPEHPEFMSWQMPTSSNPYIPQEEIEAARQELPEMAFRQEYLAEFLENEGAVFRNIGACMNASLLTVPSQHVGHTIIVGVDWGKHQDFTAISVGCATCREEIAIDRFNQIDYVFQAKRLKVLSNMWGPFEILAESNAMGEPIIEQMADDGLPIVPFQTTASSKPPLIENLALALERQEWQFIADDVWRNELEAYERRVSPLTGRSSYSAPQGMHDDTVMARALMVWASRDAYQDAGEVVTDHYSLGGGRY